MRENLENLSPNPTPSYRYNSSAQNSFASQWFTSTQEEQPKWLQASDLNTILYYVFDAARHGKVKELRGILQNYPKLDVNRPMKYESGKTTALGQAVKGQTFEAGKISIVYSTVESRYKEHPIKGTLYRGTFCSKVDKCKLTVQV